MIRREINYGLFIAKGFRNRYNIIEKSIDVIWSKLFLERGGYMSSEVYTIEQLRTMLIPVFRLHGVKRAVLFGSYGKGVAGADSDIDLLVDSRLRGLRFVGLMEDVRSTVDKDVDLLDISHVEDNSKVQEEIKKTGVLLYEE